MTIVGDIDEMRLLLSTSEFPCHLLMLLEIDEIILYERLRLDEKKLFWITPRGIMGSRLNCRVLKGCKRVEVINFLRFLHALGATIRKAIRNIRNRVKG